MTTRTGEPASKRESYTQYIQGRAAAVRRYAPPFPDGVSLARSRAESRTPLRYSFFARARASTFLPSDFFHLPVSPLTPDRRSPTSTRATGRTLWR